MPRASPPRTIAPPVEVENRRSAAVLVDRDDVAALHVRQRLERDARDELYASLLGKSMFKQVFDFIF